jgi:hypothetical protein
VQDEDADGGACDEADTAAGNDAAEAGATPRRFYVSRGNNHELVVAALEARGCATRRRTASIRAK